MKIVYVGKFNKMWDEEYIAQGFEKLGHSVVRVPDSTSPFDIRQELLKHRPDILLFAKWECPKDIIPTIEILRREGMKTVCWLFDLYFGYTRAWQVPVRWFFKADYVFTTDGGHDEEFKKAGVNHFLVRQGIRSEECYIEKGTPRGVAFVGSDSPIHPYRTEMIESVRKYIPDLIWYGKDDTDEIRGTQLNTLYANTKIVVGDSFYSPRYWSNRVVETLGRGGFLVHPKVEGLTEEYPHIVTYERGNWTHLKNIIVYFLNNEDERLVVRDLNFEHVKNNYTVEKKCAEIISHVDH